MSGEQRSLASGLEVERAGDDRPGAGACVAVVQWFEHQLHAAKDSGRCPRELWLPWEPRRLAQQLRDRSSVPK